MTGDTTARPGGGAHSMWQRFACFVGLLALGLGGLNLAGGGMAPELTAIGVMWVPALAALITALVFRDPLRGFGWKPGKWKYLAIAYVAAFAYAAIPFGIALLVGSGELTMQWWPGAAGHLGLPATPVLGFLMLATINVIFAMISALGEEMGWRGYLVPLLSGKLGFWHVVAVTWAVWLAFHLPGLLSGGYGAAGIPRWIATLDFAMMLVPLTVLMTWLRLRSGSLWPCVLAHGAHNAFIGEMFASAIIPDARTPWLFGEFGLLMPVTAAAVVFLAIRLFDRSPTRDAVVTSGHRLAS